MKIRLSNLCGQFCPVCDEWIDIRDGGYITCPHCKSELLAEDTDSDYEDWHLYERQAMPYKAFPEDNRYCVYKLDDNDEQTGSSLGCHDTMEEAQQQVEALYASEETERQANSIFKDMWQKLKSLVIKPRQTDLMQTALDHIRGEFNKQFNADDNWYNWLVDATDTYAIADFSGTMYKIPYQVVDENIIFADRDEWREVIVSYEERAISGQQVFDALWQRMFDLDLQTEGGDHYLVDIYFDEAGFYALYVDRGKLYRYDLTVQENDVTLGDRVEVMEVHEPVTSRTVIRQQPDGRYRWFSVSGTAVLNRSGEIDSRDLFDSFIEYAERTGQYPIRMFYHQGGITENWEMDESTLAYKTGQADFLARDEYCYITSGLYDDTPLAQVEIEALRNDPDYWGESIRFWPTQGELTEISNGIKIPVYTKGFNVEISTLPERDAAHLMTKTEVHMSLNGKARDAWLKLWTDAGMTEEDALKWLADNPQARNRAIEDAGMIAREETSTEEETSQEDEITPQEIEVDDELVGVIAQTVTESEAMTNLSNRIEQIETTLAERSQADQALTQAIERLNQRLDKLEGVESARQQQVNEDRPAKFNGNTRVVYRPRFRDVDPNEDGTPYAERAQNNLPKGAY